MDPDTIARIQASLGASDSHVQQRQLALHGGAIPDDPHELEFAPALWSGFGLVRAGAATAIVGSPETVAARLNDFRALGISKFILSGVPLLEEAYRVAETVFPLLRGDAAGNAALGYGALVGEGRR